MSDYDTDSAREVAARQGAQTLQQAHAVCSESIFQLDRQIVGDPRMAVIETELESGSLLPDVHAALLFYFRQLEPHMHRRAIPWWTGQHFKDADRYDEGCICRVKVPHGMAVDGYRQTTVETIQGFKDLNEWAMRSVTLPATDNGARRQSRLYLSPHAIVQCYRRLCELQSTLQLNIQSSSTANRRDYKQEATNRL